VRECQYCGIQADRIGSIAIDPTLHGKMSPGRRFRQDVSSTSFALAEQLY
jgi:hypothetical protein